jgi:hypothetical protein
MPNYLIQGGVYFYFSRKITADSLSEADDIADNLYLEDLEIEDLIWPPSRFDIDDVDEV